MKTGNRILSFALASGLALTACTQNAGAQSHSFDGAGNATEVTQQLQETYQPGFNPATQVPRYNAGNRAQAGSPAYRVRQAENVSFIYEQVYPGAQFAAGQMERTPVILRSPQNQMYYWYPATGAYGRIGDGRSLADLNRAQWTGLGSVTGANLAGWGVMTSSMLANEMAAGDAWNRMLFGAFPDMVGTTCSGAYGEPEPCVAPDFNGNPVPYGYPYPPSMSYQYSNPYAMRNAEMGAIITSILGAMSLSR